MRSISISEKIPKTLREFNVSAKDLSGNSKSLIQNAFLSSGISERNLVIWSYKKSFRVSAYSVSPFVRKKIRSRLKRSGVKGMQFRCRLMKPKDWLFRWQESYRIMPMAKRFLIVPAWKVGAVPKSKRTPIVLDPGSAFGTGGHETTRLMVRLLEPLRGKFQSFLDVGTGSGVLAIVASKLGAGRIVAFDHDAMSAKIAAKNFKRNGGEGGRFLKEDLKRLSFKKKFEVVAANLLSKTLLDYRKQLVARLEAGGYMVLSGISKRYLKAFRTGFRAPGLRCVKVLSGRSWIGALYRKGAS